MLVVDAPIANVAGSRSLTLHAPLPLSGVRSVPLPALSVHVAVAFMCTRTQTMCPTLTLKNFVLSDSLHLSHNGLFHSPPLHSQGVYNSGNSRPTQGTFMNKANNFFIWRNTCIELRKKLFVNYFFKKFACYFSVA